jgi:acetyltransferase-like isoleucine patch superfamily enzyme
MATIRGSTVPAWFTKTYELVVSHWTSPMLASLRARWVSSYFASCGSGVSVSFQCRILEPAGISVGSRTFIPNTSVIDGRGGLTIGDDCLLGFENVILTSTHESAQIDKPIREQGMYSESVTIGDDVWTGCRVTILPGVSIGPHVIIAAGSVVADDIPAWAIAGGVPARVIRDRREPRQATR